MLKQLAKFLGVGAVSTGIQYVILISLVEFRNVEPVIASTSGYLVAAVFNYLVNYYYTFSSAEKHGKAALKFALVVCIGLVLNALLMQLCVVVIGIQYLIAQVITTLIVLIWNFSANRKWTYKAA